MLYFLTGVFKFTQETFLKKIREKIDWMNLHMPKASNKWERDFVKDVGSRYLRGWELSPKQYDRLNRICDYGLLPRATSGAAPEQASLSRSNPSAAPASVSGDAEEPRSSPTPNPFAQCIFPLLHHFIIFYL